MTDSYTQVCCSLHHCTCGGRAETGAGTGPVAIVMLKTEVEIVLSECSVAGPTSSAF